MWGESTYEYNTATHIAQLPQCTFTVSCQCSEHWDAGREVHSQQIAAPHIWRKRQSWHCCTGYFCWHFDAFLLLELL